MKQIIRIAIKRNNLSVKSLHPSILPGVGIGDRIYEKISINTSVLSMLFIMLLIESLPTNEYTDRAAAEGWSPSFPALSTKQGFEPMS